MAEMTKEEIILKHTQLAKEYSDLAKSDNTLPEAEWKKINLRMLEIKSEIAQLKEIEAEWPEFQKNRKEVDSYDG